MRELAGYLGSRNFQEKKKTQGCGKEMANESEEYVQQIEEWAIHWAESVQQKDQARLIGAMHSL